MAIAQDRLPLIKDFLGSLKQFIFNRVRQDDQAARLATGIFAALKNTKAGEPALPRHFPVCKRLSEAVQAIPRDQEDTASLGNSLRALDSFIPWTRRPNSSDDDPKFEAAHANAMLVGPNGIEPREDVWIGVSIMAPHVTYPNHHHPPQEIYAVLSPGQWRQANGPWSEPGTGGLVYNPPNIVHAMRSGDHCLLAVWALLAE
jgi:quercetin dioxygenase-like cupin family protein